jgi:hypothetical protein
MTNAGAFGEVALVVPFGEWAVAVAIWGALTPGFQL